MKKPLSTTGSGWPTAAGHRAGPAHPGEATALEVRSEDLRPSDGRAAAGTHLIPETTAGSFLQGRARTLHQKRQNPHFCDSEVGDLR